ncbi:3939_t:CDS:2, partial [Funneliformis geosporum]
RTLKGKNKPKVTYNTITKKFEPNNNPSNIETEFSESDNVNINDSVHSDDNLSKSIVYPAKWPKGAKNWVWHYIQKGIHEEQSKCLINTSDGIYGHLRTEHQINKNTAKLPNLANISTGKVLIQSTIPSSFKIAKPYNDRTQNEIDRDLVNWIVENLQPFTRLIFNNVQELQQLLTQLLHDTIISISPNFELQQALLTIEEIPYPHTGLNIAEKLAKTFDH